MGQMHLLRALSMPARPAKLVATNLHAVRMASVQRQFARQAAANGVAIAFLLRDQFADETTFLAQKWAESDQQGYDDVVIMAPSTEAVQQAAAVVADGAVVNVFAGLARGTLVELRFEPGGRTPGALHRNQRLFDRGSAPYARPGRKPTAAHQPLGRRSRWAGRSSRWTACGRRGPLRWQSRRLSQFEPALALTPLAELDKVLPSVAARLDADGLWTREAEDELLRLLL
jgi:hypothetical protein